MTISQLFYPLSSKSFTLIFISVVLTACSTEESFTESTTGADTGVVQGATPEPVPELSLETAPVATLSVSSSSIDEGQSATLSWTSTNATSCTASGGWSGTRSTTGSQIVSPAATVNYILTCNGAGGSFSNSDSVTVTVNQPPPPPPAVPVVNLSVSSSSIDEGQSATLSWSSTDATSCTASGGWSGTRNTTGIVSVSPTVISTYTLSCNGAGGSASDSVTVTVNATPPPVQDINLSWVAPVEREDGTPIAMAEIAGYRVYYGTSQGSYPNQVDISNGSTMQVTLGNLVSGTYYIVVTTYDMDGRESAFSQVVTKSI
jgi:hypothetical protein